MEDKIKAIISEIKPEILNYQGENLLEDEIIDSFEVMEIIAALEDQFHIEIDPELIVVESFASLESIIEMVRKNIDED